MVVDSLVDAPLPFSRVKIMHTHVDPYGELVLSLIRLGTIVPIRGDEPR